MLSFAIIVSAQNKLPTIKSNVSQVSIEDGDQLKKNSWRLSPDAKPDIYSAEIIDGKPHQVTFITDIDRISFTVEKGKTYDFIIQWGDKICYTQIVGTAPRAVFDKKYQATHKGRIFAEIPEVYELVNVAIAMTPTGIENKNLVNHNSEYYARMRGWFDKYRNHPLLAAFEAKLKKDFFEYYHLKQDGYAFDFDEKGTIVQSKIYDRISGAPVNYLRPYLALLQSFSDASGFRKFYKNNEKTYREQIAFYRSGINIAGMKSWLDKNFPSSSDYDAYKIIFSPLVYRSQASLQFESFSFKELQPHVNFPYPGDIKNFLKETTVSEKAETIFRGDVVFTEINHGYIGPEGNKYHERILKATGNRNHWVDEKLGPNYYAGRGLFDEYMNWGLVSLRYADFVPKDEQDKMIGFNERMMTKGRGFLQFEAFDKFLVNLYRNRKPNQTIADLYPRIIEWFENNNETETLSNYNIK